jgi:phosphopantetheine--protein transferase-like protein
MVIVKCVVQDIKRFNLILLLSTETAVFSHYEREYCSCKASPVASLAGIWCAKSALMDALAQFPRFPPYAIADFEIRHEPHGRPKIELSDRLMRWCQRTGVTFDISISHAGNYAAAVILVRSLNGNLPQSSSFSQEFDSLCQTTAQL